MSSVVSFFLIVFLTLSSVLLMAHPLRVAEISIESTEIQEQSVQLSARMSPTLGHYFGIFVLSAAVLNFELSLTRIFAVVLWSNLAFMVVSTALFGFGLSGVYLALKREESFPILRSPSAVCLLTGVSMLFAYWIVNTIPFRISHLGTHFTGLLALGVWEISLLLPFFFAGIIVAQLLSRYSHS